MAWPALGNIQMVTCPAWPGGEADQTWFRSTWQSLTTLLLLLSVHPVVLSVVLTVLLNVVLRAFRGARDRVARDLAERASPSMDDGDERRLRVLIPWKAMIVASLILTIVVNVVLRIT